MSRCAAVRETWRSLLRPVSVWVAYVMLGAGLCEAAPDKFEVASIKPSAGCNGFKVQGLSNGRLIVQNAPLRVLLEYAFHVKSWEIASVPAWASSACYDIAAKAATRADAHTLWSMLVPLFEERFGMKTHREKRELPAYNLIVAKSGNLPAPREGNCVGSDPTQAPTQSGRGKRLLTACGAILMPFKPPAAEMYGGKVQMERLVENLTSVLGRPVIDKTGFTGLFDLDLKFAVGSSGAGRSGPITGPANSGGFALPSEPSDLPDIFGALKQQLGLKLQASKAPVEVIVIDRLQRPLFD